MMLSQAGRRCLRACAAVGSRQSVLKSSVTSSCVQQIARPLSLMSKIPFIGKGKEDDEHFDSVVSDRSEEW